MPNLPDPSSPGIPTADFSRSLGPHSKRERPLDPVTGTAEAGRVPLRLDAGVKLQKRESRLGLRSIFGRHRGASDSDKGLGPPREPSQKPGGIRASLAEINWPYGSHHSQGHQSDLSLPSFSKPAPTQSLRHKKSASGVRPQPSAEGLAPWQAPPLFQAYPQAIKHAHLPACTASPEAILRQHHHKTSGSLGNILNPSTPDIPEAVTGEKSERPKRRHRRNLSGATSKFEWTTKVFVLVTSGYLLQYAGEGSFDRLPERVLQLGKESAAFASDVIPGRHWVLQVSAVAELDGAPGTHSSIRARLPFRGQEKRLSPTFLMVFESAEEMDSWIAILRREIEALGGRKVLSETGKPKDSGQQAELRNQASQRTLVVRDPDRFSRIMSPERSWIQDPPMSSQEVHHLEPGHEDLGREQSFDDTSTASVISHDGKQLDSLRDSTNRFSFMSSGQRTMITSAGSSPACSPIRDSFAELEPVVPGLPPPSEQPQPRLRPNAKAIIDRRQSLQTINHVFEMRVASAQAFRSLPMHGKTTQPDVATPPVSPPPPNFSAPQGPSTRFLPGRTPPPVSTHTSSPLLSGRFSARRPPPSALSINPRPLSLVVDQPSPILSPLNRVRTGSESAGSPLSATPVTPPISSTSSRNAENASKLCELQGHSSCESNHPEHENTPEIATQRPSPLREELGDVLGRHEASLAKDPSLESRIIPRATSSLGIYSDKYAPGSAVGKQGVRVRRRSFTAAQQSLPASFAHRELHNRPQTPSLRPMPRSLQHLKADSQVHQLLQQRSIAQLTEGPPPGPPPKRALPAIPQKSSRTNLGPPPGFI
ncbi:hypothetical protein VTK26DRAFT_1593 [Humicola hyalothermophila]